MADGDQYARIVARASSQIQDAARVQFGRMMQDAVAQYAGAVDGMLGYLGENFSDFERKHQIQLANAHLNVGRATMRSVVAGFDNRRMRRPVARYRAGDNRLSGKLRRALLSDDHIDRGIRHLRVINTSLLDREAAHWRRLNFGAGSIGGQPGPEQFTITWEGVALGTLGLDPDPRPGFVIPFGYWLGKRGIESPSGERRGMDQFFPGAAPAGPGASRYQRRRPTGGIAARNFLDAGVRRLANELPRAYATIFEDAFSRAEGELGEMARAPQRIPFHYRRGVNRRRG